jgi:transcriptional regulator with XRE-family HTH domain
MDFGRFGRSIRAVRVKRGWRQQDLAVKAGLTRSVIGRIERGEEDGLSVAALDAVSRALGGSLDLLFRWQGVELDRLLDASHARLVEVMVRLLQLSGWEVAVEATFSRFGERGSIDILAFHARLRILLVVEVKSVIPDIQATLAGLDRKGRLAPEIALARGWHATVVAVLLVCWDTRSNRRRIERHAASVRAILPAGTREMRRWLRDPTLPPVSGVLFLSDIDGTDRVPPRAGRVHVPPA